MFNLSLNKNTFLSLCVFRCGVAALTLIHILSLYNDYDTLYSSNGIIREEVNTLILDNTPVLTIHALTHWVAKYSQCQEAQAINLVLFVYITALIFIFLGFMTRFSALIAFLIHTALDNGATVLSYGYDSFTNNCLLYCILMPVGYYYSVDNFIFKRKNAEDTPLSRLSIRLLQIQLCTIYFMSGINKSFGSDWYNGECIWRAVMQPPLGKIDMSFLATFPFIAVSIGISVLIIEIFYPFFIHFTRIHKYFICIVILMHLSIAITLNLWFFAGIMIIWNIAAYGIPIYTRTENASTKSLTDTRL
jgi:hypothetical protein